MFFLLYSGKCNLHFNLNSHDDSYSCYEKYFIRLLEDIVRLVQRAFQDFIKILYVIHMCNDFN